MSPFNGQCRSSQLELVIPDDYPLVFCIDGFTGMVGYTFGEDCTGSRREHVVPDDGDLLTCVNYYTTVNRWVEDHSQCKSNETPNIIPVA